MFFGRKTINDSIFCENKIAVVIEISMLSGNLKRQTAKGEHSTEKVVLKQCVKMVFFYL